MEKFIPVILRHITTQVCILAILIVPSISMGADFKENWSNFKSSFMQANGRIIDTGNQDISHTEGQGYGMLFALHADEPETFKEIWAWTKSNMQIREDKLLSWSWKSGDGVNDLNNASDGDLLIAWALLEANQKWSEKEYLIDALEIISDIKANLIQPSNVGKVLLPGIVGFNKPDEMVVNPSYWIFPAINVIMKTDASQKWQELRMSGYKLLTQAQYGEWKLPPDWLSISKNGIEPADKKRFGYDAIRIPLYLMMDKQTNLQTLEPFKRFWRSFRDQPILPPWINLEQGALANYNASPGIHCIAGMTIAFPNMAPPCAQIRQEDGYYSAALILLSQIAEINRLNQ